MFCPFCDHKDSRVLESRLTGENSVRRRRQCEECDKRFTTYERVEVIQLLIIKRSGNREPYTREKLRAGIARACAKTAITASRSTISSSQWKTSWRRSGKRNPFQRHGRTGSDQAAEFRPGGLRSFRLCLQAIPLDRELRPGVRHSKRLFGAAPAGNASCRPKERESSKRLAGLVRLDATRAAASRMPPAP